MDANKLQLSLCMIVRDEEDFLARCLTSAKDVVDEIIIVDTGSSDLTKEIAKEFSAQIHDFQWEDDFSAARNFGLGKARGEWILVLDADEQLEPGAGPLIREALASDNGPCGFYLTFIDLQGETEETSAEQTFPILRLFKNATVHRFKGTVHEQVQLDYDSVGALPAKIRHLGNLAPVLEKRRKRQRDAELLKDSGWGDDVQHLWILANQDMNNRKPKAALEKYLQVYERLKEGEKTHLPNTVLQIIQCNRALKRSAERDRWIEIGLERWPQYTDIEFLRAVSYFEAKAYRKALQTFRSCIELGNPGARFATQPGCWQWDAWTGVGVSHAHLREYRQAVDAFLEALKLNPRSAWAADNLAKLLLSQGHDRGSVRNRLARTTDRKAPEIKEVFKRYFGGASFRGLR